MRKPEALLAKRVSNFLQRQYPTVIFRFDASADIKLTIGQATQLKKLQGGLKGYPDCFIAKTKKDKKGRIKYAGLYIELKATKNGKVPNTAHTRKQAAIHQILRNEGYKVEFSVGYENTVQLIQDYLNNS